MPIKPFHLALTYEQVHVLYDLVDECVASYLKEEDIPESLEQLFKKLTYMENQIDKKTEKKI